MEKEKVVVGMSGGVDSSVSAFLAAKALGSENVTGVMMPYKSSSKSSLTDAKKVVKSLGIKSKKIEITPMVDAYTENSGIKKFTPKRLGNIMARMRMIVLYDLSAMLDALVIGTGNKTEADMVMLRRINAYSFWDLKFMPKNGIPEAKVFKNKS